MRLYGYVGWITLEKVDNKEEKCYNRKQTERKEKMGSKKQNTYTTEFKKTIVNLYRSGKTYAEIQKEYGVSHSALANWIKLYSEVKIDDETIITAEQIKALQKRNAQLEEENLILKKAIAIFSPHSDKD